MWAYQLGRELPESWDRPIYHRLWIESALMKTTTGYFVVICLILGAGYFVLNHLHQERQKRLDLEREVASLAMRLDSLAVAATTSRFGNGRLERTHQQNYREFPQPADNYILPGSPGRDSPKFTVTAGRSYTECLDLYPRGYQDSRFDQCRSGYAVAK